MVLNSAPPRPTTGPITVGIVGCGSVVDLLHMPVLSHIPGVKIQWVCDADRDRARRLARNWRIPKYSPDINNCENVDAVLVATPLGSRASILEYTTRCGWHALCEKPFASDLRQHTQMIDAALKNRVIIVAGFMRRHWWAVRHVRHMICSETLGSLQEVIATESAHLERTGIDMSSYRNNANASGGGVLYETGCHLIDLALFASNALNADVRMCHQRFCDGYEIETSAMADLHLSSGAHATLKVCISGTRPLFQGVTFRCKGGDLRLRLEPTSAVELVTSDFSRAQIAHPRATRPHAQTLAAFTDEWAGFISLLRGRCDYDAWSATGFVTTQFISQCAAISESCSEVCR